MEVENVQEQGVQETAEAVAPAEPETPPAEAAAPQVETVESQEESLPEDETKRREAFISMRRRIAELEGQNDGSAEEDAILERLRGRTVQAPSVPFSPDMDASIAVQRMMAAEQAAIQSQNSVAELEKRLEDERLYAKFPELDPSNPDSRKPENKDFAEFLAGQLIVSKMQGKPTDLVKLAERVKEKFSSLSAPQREAAAQAAVEDLTKREQASLEARGSSVDIPGTKGDDESSREGARKGDTDALGELMKRVIK